MLRIERFSIKQIIYFEMNRGKLNKNDARTILQPDQTIILKVKVKGAMAQMVKVTEVDQEISGSNPADTML